ncbi:MAG: IS1182 family transposase, partial [Hyphomicrobiales bacterium]|nr:IS1182 family transposase [Hyphomicrobiales bacterium]
FVRAAAKATGWPGHAPGDLLKLYIYGYLNCVRSSRRLEAEANCNIEVMWLLRRLRPDFKTIADFRRDNAKAFRKVFRSFVLACRDLDLFGRELLAIDGTRIKAVNNKDRNHTQRSLESFIQQADARLDDYLRRLDESDADRGGKGGGSRTDNLAPKITAPREKRGRYLAILDDLKRSGEDQVSLTDLDCRAMMGNGRVQVACNVQIAVDVKHKLIAEQEVSNAPVDMGLLTETAKAACEMLGVSTIDAVGDRGYFKTEAIVVCEAAGIVPQVPKPQRGPAVHEGFFRKDEFRYLADQDAYVCPGGQVLATRTESKLRDLKKVDYSNRHACSVCPLQPRCTTRLRKVSRIEGEEVLERIAERLKARPELLDLRRQSVEHPFGSIKQWMNQGAFPMRRLPNAR